MMIRWIRDGWEIDTGSATIMIECQTHEYDRGGCMGVDYNHGSSVAINRAHWNQFGVLTITNREYPNCPSSLVEIINEHILQMELGTFGEVSAPHFAYTEDLRSVLHFIKEEPKKKISEYNQIPIFVDTHQHWTMKSNDGKIHKVYRKYQGGYYITKIVSTLESFEHPLREGVPNNNVIAQISSVEFTSLFAKPFDSKEMAELIK